MTPTPSATITDFSNFVDATKRLVGGAGTITGGLFTYPMPSTMVVAFDGTAVDLHVTGTVSGFAGFGLYFDGCLDASAFSAIQFTTTGTVGTCALELQVQTNSDEPIDTTGMRGTCTANCSLPVKLNVTGVPGVITVQFNQLTGGSPNPFNSRELRGVQWQLTTAGTCTPDFTIDNVQFVMGGG